MLSLCVPVSGRHHDRCSTLHATTAARASRYQWGCGGYVYPPIRMASDLTDKANSSSAEASDSRRLFLATLGGACLLAAPGPPVAVAAAAASDTAAAAAAASVSELQSAALRASATSDFAKAVRLLTLIIGMEPEEPKWREMRAQVGEQLSQRWNP